MRSVHDVFGVPAGEPEDPPQLGAAGRDVAATDEQPGPLGLELGQVVVVAELGGQRDRLVERRHRGVVRPRHTLQVTQRRHRHPQPPAFAECGEELVRGTRVGPLTVEVALVLRQLRAGEHREGPRPRVGLRIGRELFERPRIAEPEACGHGTHELQDGVPVRRRQVRREPLRVGEPGPTPW